MSKRHENITPEISTWIREQRVFFVATAPRALDGHINVSPKAAIRFGFLVRWKWFTRITPAVARRRPPMLARIAELS